MDLDELEVTLKMLNIDYIRSINTIKIDVLKYSVNKSVESILPALKKNGYEVMHNYIEGFVYLTKQKV